MMMIVGAALTELTVIMTAIMATVTVTKMKKVIMVMTMGSKTMKEECCSTIRVSES